MKNDHLEIAPREPQHHKRGIKKQYCLVDDLRAVIPDVWDQIGDNATQNLVKSKPRRTFEVIRIDGGPIDY
ncbi:hypothetical protein ANCCAN_27216 [Ancylostoma caninum]|uniref:Uncharacterized protein n=1 Tax=Ancylostoma caninum TaxID=29170 RepID=A0A368F4K4_ANCCA|nr:hypothetical protein ANCCAN_27216 [Ancylostoma caninum]